MPKWSFFSNGATRTRNVEKDYAEQRRRMVRRQLEARGIHDQAMLDAFRKVPRHLFVSLPQRSEAYRDGPLPIGDAQTISQPFMTALMVQQAHLNANSCVLEIGTGSGYQTAILAEVCRWVFSVERIERLARTAESTLIALGVKNFEIRIGDGTQGWPEKAPFDAVVVSAGAAKQPPKPLLDQLAVQGRLVIPLQHVECQILHVFTRTETGFESEQLDACSFVPLIGKHGWPEE